MKKAKKLKLHLETLRQLDLPRIQGGTDTFGCGPSLNCGFLPGQLTYGCTDDSRANEN